MPLELSWYPNEKTSENTYQTILGGFRTSSYLPEYCIKLYAIYANLILGLDYALKNFWHDPEARKTIRFPNRTFK
jgi:hypothetical protein